MIEKLEPMVKAVPLGIKFEEYEHGNYVAELTVSTMDIVSKLNEVIDRLNELESNG
jgi:hypothetical protein